MVDVELVAVVVVQVAVGIDESGDGGRDRRQQAFVEALKRLEMVGIEKVAEVVVAVAGQFGRGRARPEGQGAGGNRQNQAEPDAAAPRVPDGGRNHPAGEGGYARGPAATPRRPAASRILAAVASAISIPAARLLARLMLSGSPGTRT